MLRPLLIATLATLLSCSGDSKSTEAPGTNALGSDDARHLEYCERRLAEVSTRGSKIGVLELVDACLPTCPPRRTAATTAAACKVEDAPADAALAGAALAWIESMRARSGAETSLGAIDQSLAKLVIVLSLPASSAAVPAGAMTSAPSPRMFVRLEGHKMFVGAAPAATAVGGKLAMLARPFPGVRATRSELLGTWNELSSKLEERETPPADGEDSEDDGEDSLDSSGTGTKMALDEGKMGTRESSRESGRYTMKDNNVEPKLARDAALEAARKAGVLGVLTASSPPLVIADAKQSAAPVAAVTGTFSRSMLAVTRDGELAPHAVVLVKFGTDRSVFIDVVDGRVAVSGNPGAEIAAVDGAPDWSALAAYLKRHDLASDVVLQISVENSVEELVGMLDVLGRLGAEQVGIFGGDPSQPRVDLKDLKATGDLDINIIRRYVDRSLSKSGACYSDQLAVDPALSGVVEVDLTIAPTGRTQNVTATQAGLNAEVATCINESFKAIYFPRPRNGGTATVKATVRLSY